MEYIDLVNKFTNIGRTHEWDKLYDLLVDDFYFKSPLNHIIGAKNFIEFERNRSNIVCHETLYLFEAHDKFEYYHIYNLTYYHPTYFELVVHEIIGIKNDLISYSILNAKFDSVPGLHP